MTTLTAQIERSADSTPLRLAPGVELLGEFTDSGFTQPQYLVRRPDGQVILISRLLYQVAAAIAQHDEVDAIARVASETLGRPISAGNVDYLIENKLRPAGVLASGADEPITTMRANPLLALRLRVGVVPQRAHRAATLIMRPLFRTPVIALALMALAVIDAWAVAHASSITAAGVQVASRPVLFLVLTLLTFAAMAFHELGHATACRYGGGSPGAMGMGVYIVWPAFYTDVTDAYRLDRRGRLRTDLGGIYFNLLFALGAAVVYAATGFAPLLALIVLTQLQALYQLLPFVRLDGYYILGDLIGIPNLFAYLRAAAATLLPVAPATRRDAERTMASLTPRARLAVRVWVALTVPVLVLNLGLVAVLAPRILPAYLHSARLLGRTLVHAVGGGEWIAGLNAIFQLLFLIIPVLGWAVLGTTTLLALRRPLVRAAAVLGRAARHPVPAGGLVAAALAGAALVAVMWLAASGSSPRTPAGATGSAAAAQLVAEPVLGREPAQETPAVGESRTTPGQGTPRAAANAPTAPVTPAPPAPAVPAQTDSTGTAAAAISGPGSSWTVRAGDDLWFVAQETLTGLLGRPSSEDETRSYWMAVIAANAPTIDDPNLLHAGQLIALPAVPQPDGSQRTAEAGTPTIVPDTGLEPTRPPASLQDSTGGILPTPVAQGAWTVRAGDHLWLVADQVMTRVLGRPSSQAETTSYWQSLIGSNRTTLTDPNLLHPGERLILPALARPDGEPSGAPGAADPSG